MKDQSDVQLLRAYAEHRDETAFREIVTRYTDLVYSAALRQVESSVTARDIAQGVFSDLARKSGELAHAGDAPAQRSLAGWLHRATRYAALNHLRDARRRLNHERQAMEQLLANSGSLADWEQIRPALDEALDSLGDEEREALLLRYFKNQDFRTVGIALGISDDAAQKRVSRAVERLREFFSKRNVTIGSSGLVALIAANAVQSAPIGLAAAISTAITLTTSTIGMTMIHKFLIAGTTTVAIVAGLYSFKLHDTNEALRQEQVEQLSRERDDAKNQLAALQQASETSQTNESELLELRNEVTQLRRQRIDMPATAQPETNSAPVAETISILLISKFVSLPTEDLQGLGVNWTMVGQNGKFGTLTEQQFKIVNEALQGASDADVISAPRAITVNGGEAEVSATRAVPDFGTNATVGTTLHVTPFYLTNSSMFNLSLSAKLSQLTGDPSQPDLQTIQVTNQASLSPGQVVVLETEIPPGGWMPDVTNVPAGPRSLLVFVTPRVVGPRGFQNRQ